MSPPPGTLSSRDASLALREEVAGVGEAGGAEFFKDFHGAAGVGQGLRGAALAREGLGEAVVVGGDTFEVVA